MHLCFVCAYNEGRSAHLAVGVTHRLQQLGVPYRISSAGLFKGRGMNPRRVEYLIGRGVAPELAGSHCSAAFGPEHAEADLVLVAEHSMQRELLTRWPGLVGRIMSIRGFSAGRDPHNDLTPAEAHLEDSYNHTDDEKYDLYEELESLCDDLAARLAQRASGMATRPPG
jgi:protein-tyrosine-phosphatase